MNCLYLWHESYIRVASLINICVPTLTNILHKLCSTLQHSLQHTSTLCNTLHSLQHTLHSIYLYEVWRAHLYIHCTHCDTLQHNTTQCNTHCGIRCSTLQYTIQNFSYTHRHRFWQRISLRTSQEAATYSHTGVPCVSSGSFNVRKHWNEEQCNERR